jgi:aryl-alcohol dehydrogenase-like predicted oxidoreductase
MAILGYTPLLWGSYTRPEKYAEIDRLKAFVRPQNDERRKRLERVAAETGRSVNEVIYAWMMQSTPEVIPLVAVSKLEHLKEDLAAADLTLSAEQLAVLNAPLV